jgi:hypothetical protein
MKRLTRDNVIWQAANLKDFVTDTTPAGIAVNTSLRADEAATEDKD